MGCYLLNVVCDTMSAEFQFNIKQDAKSTFKKFCKLLEDDESAEIELYDPDNELIAWLYNPLKF